MKRKYVALILVFIVISIYPMKASGVFGVGDIVFDPSNIVYQILHYVYELQDIVYQVEQISQLVLHYETFLLNLEPSQIPIIGPLLEAYAGILEAFNRAEGIVYDWKHVRPEFRVLYPELQYGVWINSWGFLEKQYAWNLQARQAHETSFETQGIYYELGRDLNTLRQALERSDAAVGNLEVQQEGNKINAVVATQLLRTQEILAAQARADASRTMYEIGMDEISRQNVYRWVGENTLVKPWGGGLHELPTLR